MNSKLRIATFNLENLDKKSNKKPTLKERIAVMRSQLIRLNADILCLQEINGQEKEGHPRSLLALEELIESTAYAEYYAASTKIEDGTQVYDERNLVILSRYEIIEHYQYKHEYAPAPYYSKVTEPVNEEGEKNASKVTWKRPVFHARIKVGDEIIEVINLHLKSRQPSYIKGQKLNRYTWKTAAGWAEGYFISSMKRVGQALEVRMLIDDFFNKKEDALIVVCGDFNADINEVPIEAIRGDVENTNNSKLAGRVMVPCELTIPEPSRFTFLHRGGKRMIDHLLVSRSLLAYYRGGEIHNELLHDESIGTSSDRLFPESDHAPIIAEFEIPMLDN